MLARLKELDYRFTAVTPATHGSVLARAHDGPATLRDVFGWNRPFRSEEIDASVLESMKAAEILRSSPEGLRSMLRVASLGEDLFLHSAFPTEGEDAVFFGPDTYRFARFIAQHLPQAPGRVVDMGAGSGAGGLWVARLRPDARVVLVDTNEQALQLAAVNARACGREVELVLGGSVPGSPDLVIANPPYMIDEDSRAYRDGGALFGGQVAADWTRDALGRLAPGGALLLYTGAAIVGGVSPLVTELARICAEAGASMECEELDPDVFGEELTKPPYAEVERIAALGIVVRRGAT